MLCRLRQLLILSLILTAWGAHAAGEALPVLRIGLVKYGAAGWEIDTIRHHQLDKRAGIILSTADFASASAAEIALAAGSVDAIFTDWLWVDAQRRAGRGFVFLPHSAALGDIMVPRDSPVRRLADLAGRRLGVAGGPNDKSWLLLRAFSRGQGNDVATLATPVFAAPPLLSQELAAGRLDAALTFWPFAARLAVRGYRSIGNVGDWMEGLGLKRGVPMLGFALSEAWISGSAGGAAKFADCLAAADRLLQRDEEWERLRPLLDAEDAATASALRDRFRDGLRLADPAGSVAQAARLLAILSGPGGGEPGRFGPAPDPGTFWLGAGR